MQIFKRKLVLLILLVIGFTITIVWFDLSADNSIHKKQKEIAAEFVYESKKEQITETIATIYSLINSGLKNGYELHEEQLEKKSQNFISNFQLVQKQKWCSLLHDAHIKDKNLLYKLQEGEKILCESKDFQALINSSEEFEKSLHVKSFIAQDTALELLLKKEKIYSFVQKRVSKLLHELKFKNPDIYVWVNEVVNYNGGDGYAIRKIHPNLVATEGQPLSTNTKDIKGNHPYLEELEGIKKDGEAYFTYYFKKKSSDDISQKLAYAKLFKPFNWIIATGIYIDDIEAKINEKEKKLQNEMRFHTFLLICISTILASVLIFLLYKKERYEESIQENEIKEQSNLEKVKNYQQVLYSMLDIVEKRDTYTAGHTQRVARYSVLIAEAMQLPREKIDILFEAAIMHDIGKISTPDNILLKPGKLSFNEYKIIQEHLTCGYEILSSINAFYEHAEIMRNHHERYDGKGYPRGLKGYEISTLSHILILADAFDAMTSKRIYKASKTLNEALKELEELKGKQFSPLIVEAAIPVLKKNGVIPAEHDYLSNYTEEARLAYYYKDSMTDVYNYKYLEHILFFSKQSQKSEYNSCIFINMKNFHQYNKLHSWLGGNEKIKEIATKLKEYFKGDFVFRVYGDDFLILNKKELHVEKKVLIKLLDLEGDVLDLELHTLDLKGIEAHNFDELTEYIDSFVLSLK